MDIIDKQMASAAPPLDQQFYYDYKKLTFNNRSFNYFEVAYNMAVSDIMFGNTLKAYKTLASLLDIFPEGEIKSEFAKFVALVQKQTRDPFAGRGGRNEVEEAQFIPFPV